MENFRYIAKWFQTDQLNSTRLSKWMIVIVVMIDEIWICSGKKKKKSESIKVWMGDWMNKV